MTSDGCRTTTYAVATIAGHLAMRSVWKPACAAFAARAPQPTARPETLAALAARAEFVAALPARNR